MRRIPVVIVLPRVSLGMVSQVSPCPQLFEPVAVGWLAVLGLATLFYSLTRSSRRSSWVIGCTYGLAFTGPLLWWLQESRGTVAWVALTLMQTAWLTFASVLVSVLAKVRVWPVWAAAARIGVEELRSTLPFGGLLDASTSAPPHCAAQATLSRLAVMTPRLRRRVLSPTVAGSILFVCPTTRVDGSSCAGCGPGVLGVRLRAQRPAYEWSPLPNRLMPTKLNNSVANPANATHAARRPRQPPVTRACR